MKCKTYPHAHFQHVTLTKRSLQWGHSHAPH